MGRQRTRVVLFTVWLATLPLLVYVADVPFLLAFAGYFIGTVVIELYTRTLQPDSLTRVERAVPVVAKGILAVIAVGAALLLAFILVGLVVAWLRA